MNFAKSIPSAFSPYIACKVPDGETGIWRVKTIAASKTFPKFQTFGKVQFKGI